MSEENVTTIKGNEWMSETVTSIAYKEEITATVCFSYFSQYFSVFRFCDLCNTFLFSVNAI